MGKRQRANNTDEGAITSDQILIKKSKRNVG